MSSRRGGLLSNARRNAPPSSAPAPAARRPAGPVEPPSYEAPACPLSDTAVRALSDMSHNRTISKKYEDHLRKSAELLASSVFAVNDRLRDRQGLLVALVEKREQKGGEKNEAEELTERAAESLGRQVPDITLKLETAMRMTVDDQAELVNSKAAAAAMIQQVNQAHNLRRQQSQPRRRHQAVEDDEDEAEAPMEDAPVEVPVVGAVELLEIARKDMIKEYNALSAHQRYALQNDYIHFKGLWHEGAHRDDETPLPDASTWFDNDGNPVIRWGGEGAGAGDDDDADLVVEREVRSYTCPLSLRPLRDPYSSHKCKHTFDKEAIFEYLANGARQCPVAGCSQSIGTRDIYPDGVILRKIKRAEQLAARRGPAYTSDIEPDEDEDVASLVQGRTRDVKREKLAKSGRATRHEDEMEE